MFTDGDNGSRNRFRRITSAKKKSSQINNDEFADFYKSYDESAKTSKESKNNSKKDNFKIDYDKLNIDTSDDDYQEEEQVEYDYGDDTNYNEINKEERKKKIKKILLIVVIALFLIIGVIIAVLLINDPRIKLNEKEMTLMVGESKYISFEVVNTEESIATTFSSEDIDVATVDENGNVKAVGPGTTNIVVSYNVNSRKKKEKCKVTVKSDKEEEPTTKKPDDIAQNTTTTTATTTTTTTNKTTSPPNTTGSSSCDKTPSLSISISNAQENVWTNKDVVINISSSSNCGASVDLKYALDCSSGCNYTNISGNSITISNSGTHKVTIVAHDSKSNKEISNSVTLKIDKTAPVLTLLPDGSTSFSPKSANTKKMRICAKCVDNESGCKESEVCKTYSASTSDTLSAMDNAGNTGTSKIFTVSIP